MSQQCSAILAAKSFFRQAMQRKKGGQRLGEDIHDGCVPHGYASNTWSGNVALSRGVIRSSVKADMAEEEWNKLTNTGNSNVYDCRLKMISDMVHYTMWWHTYALEGWEIPQLHKQALWSTIATVSHLSRVLTRVVNRLLSCWLVRRNSCCVVHADDPCGDPARSNSGAN